MVMTWKQIDAALKAHGESLEEMRNQRQQWLACVDVEAIHPFDVSQGYIVRRLKEDLRKVLQAHGVETALDAMEVYATDLGRELERDRAADAALELRHWYSTGPS